jgi:MYXO-CTERM domain-containing protein
VLSGLPGASIVHYYVSVETTENNVTVPTGAEINPFSFVVGDLTELYFEDFEGDDGGYEHELVSGQESQGADDWQHGTPVGLAGDPDFCYSGDGCWGNDLGGSRDGADWNGEYQNEKHNRISSPAIAVGDDEGQLILQFRRWLTVEDGYYDNARVLVDGEVVWTNHESRQSVGDEHHLDAQWSLATVEIEDVDGDGEITVSWELVSDQGLSMGGWTMDDVAVYRLTEGQAPDGGVDTGDTNGTIELTPTGCGGCASGSVPAGGLLAGLVGMLGLVAVRRRR